MKLSVPETQAAPDQFVNAVDVDFNSLDATGAAATLEPQVENSTPSGHKRCPLPPIRLHNHSSPSSAIKLNEATMARLAVLLRSGCSVQHVCDDVRSSAVNAPFCFIFVPFFPPSTLLFVHRLVCPGHRSIVGRIALARMTPRTYTMSECKIIVRAVSQLA